MIENIIAPFKNHNFIAKAAKDFLNIYHPDNTYPIPVEEIIEFNLKLDIIPIPGLHKIFDIDGFLSSNRKSISVDESVYQSRPGRYRFTLAHELGHFVLHKDIYNKRKFTTADDWKKFIENFEEKQYYWFEWQAYEFAGLILVPTDYLIGRHTYHIKRIRSFGIVNEDVILDAVIEFLAEDFIVSRDVIQRRLKRDIKI